uniref:Transmembrane 9 superfamily member n=1 Tax=Chaetoceros debilis TaxID=122233 RepID=A0A7S3QEP7_9STRA
MLKNSALLTAALAAFHTVNINGFYLPGVAPRSFHKEDVVELKVNKLTSIHDEYPIEYYRLPFCQPDKGVSMVNENLGEFLSGDRIENSPYKIKMQKDMYCEQVCISHLGRVEARGVSPSKMVRAIKRNYHDNWIIDNLPSASKLEDEHDSYVKYSHGFPIGFVANAEDAEEGSKKPEDLRAYINNHVNIELEYHEVDGAVPGTKEYRIVRFIVEPFSIKHDFVATFTDDDDAENYLDEGNLDEGRKVAKINNPIASCDASVTASEKKHTTYQMAVHSPNGPQPASGKVLFTYDVKWTENKDVSWASRWDIYLSMAETGVPNKVHWLSISNSLVIVFVLTSMIAAVLVRNLRRDYDRYSKLPTDEERNEDLEEFGWKLVHADVFRPPSHPMVLSVCCGTGMQLLCMSIMTVVFATMGFLSPARRGSLIMALLILYVLMGGVAGYVTSRMYKTFKGKSWQKATIMTAFGFPAITFAVFFVMDLLAISKQSSDAVPFTRMLILILLWFGISTPLVFMGAYFGFKQDAIEFPVNTSNIPRQIPDQPWFMGWAFTTAVGGVMPFGACFLELFFIMSSIWMDQYYYVFGFLFLTFVILLLTCAEITILFTYFQICGEDYRWWWRSFSTGGATALYVYGYSFHYFKQLESNSVATYILYFGYMALICFGLYLITGTVGLLSALWFNKKIFGSIKID